jgi:hypothetical protein
MVETLVAFLLLVLGVLATFQLLDTSRRTSLRAEESQALNDIGQRELEQIRALDYEEIALNGAPVTNANENHPGSRVTGTPPGARFHLDPESPVDSANDPVIVQNGGSRQAGGTIAGGQVSPSEPFTTGDVSGTIYRYVVWRNDPTCVTCTGTQDYKRVIVAVKVDQAPSAGFDRSYQEFQTDVIDPEAGPLTSGSGAGGNLTTAQQFWLTDDSCQGSGEPAAEARVPGNDLTNNTTGTCTGSSRPDALISEAPPDPDSNDPANPAVGDYATDLEPGCSTTNCSLTDSGLQMLSQSGCNASPSSSAQHRIHWWATRRLVAGDGGAFVAAGESTLELWTRSISPAQGIPGSLCIYLRERPVNLLFVELTAIPIQIVSISSPTEGFSCQTVNAASGIGKCSAVSWPSGSWSKLRIKLATNTLSLGLNSRIEIGISVDGATGESLEFLYDHPTYDSRYEIITTTPL